MSNKLIFAPSLITVAAATYYILRKTPRDPIVKRDEIEREKNPKLSDAQAKQDIQEWREYREKECRKPFGWLSLAGLHWLKKSDNVIGTGSSAKIIFDVAQKETYPDKFGIITLLEDESLVFKAQPGVGVTVDGRAIGYGEEVPLLHDDDSDANPTILSFSALQWFVIKRSGQYGIRLKDSNNPVLVSFQGIKNFPINLDLRVEGTFKPYTPPKQLQISTGIGTIDKPLCPGYISFDIGGKTHTLDVTGDRSTKFHVTFADTTSGKETYGGGRMLNIPGPLPGSDKVLVDFNKAYNPPCAFTDFATCGLVMIQNRLNTEIRAGEMKYGDH